MRRIETVKKFFALLALTVMLGNYIGFASKIQGITLINLKAKKTCFFPYYSKHSVFVGVNPKLDSIYLYQNDDSISQNNLLIYNFKRKLKGLYNLDKLDASVDKREIAVSPNEKQIVFFDYDKKRFNIYSLLNSKITYFNFPIKFGSLCATKYISDHEFIVIARPQNTTNQVIVKINTKRLTKKVIYATQAGDSIPIQAFAYSKSTRYLSVALNQKMNPHTKILFFDLVKGKMVYSIDTAYSLRFLCWSINDCFFTFISNTMAIPIYKLKFSPLSLKEQNKYRGKVIAFFARKLLDNHRLVIEQQNSVSVYNLKTQQVEQQYPIEFSGISNLYSPSKVIVIGTTDATQILCIDTKPIQKSTP
jgi:hypothetical protein